MTKLITILTIACISLSTVSVHATQSTFDTDAEEWSMMRLWTFGNPPTGDPGSRFVWESTAGNPGGCVRLTEYTYTNDVFKAPTAYLGDKSSAFGTNFTFDLWTSRGGEHVSAALVGGSTTLYYWSTPTGGSWNHTVIPLVGSGWKKDSPLGPDATDADMLDVLGNVLALYIWGDFTSYSDEYSRLDNVFIRPVITRAHMNIWSSSGFELFMRVVGDFEGIELENEDISLYANGERLPMELIEQDGGFVHTYGIPGPPLPTEYEVTIRDRWATSEPYVLGVLRGYPQGAPEMLYPEDGQLITETQPTFRWQAFKSLYDGLYVDASGYEIDLKFPNGDIFSVWSIPGDQTALDYINPNWTPSQPPAMSPGIYAVNVHSLHSVAPGFGFEHHGGIHFEVVEDPAQLLDILAQQVIDLNLHSGIANSLDAKLDTALKAIDDLNQNNDAAAVNSLGAFINAVEAQRGSKITEADADALIAAAQQIIDLLLAE